VPSPGGKFRLEAAEKEGRGIPLPIEKELLKSFMDGVTAESAK